MLVVGKQNYKLCITSLVAVMLYVSIMTSYAFSQSTFTRDQVLQDAQSLEKLLKKYHPNLYAHRQPSKLNSIWKNVKSKLPNSPSYLDAATLFQQILAAVCDEHTEVLRNNRWTSSSPSVSQYFPFGLVVVGKNLYLDNSGVGKKNPEVIAINGKSSAAIISFLKSLTSEDACQKVDVLFSHHIDSNFMTPILLSKFLGFGPQYDVKLKNSDTEEVTSLSLNAISWRRKSTIGLGKTSAGRSILLERLGISIRESEWRHAQKSYEQILVRASSDQSIYYVYVPSFGGGVRQTKAIDTQIRDIVKAGPNHVIVDLMDNPGGNSPVAQRFLSYFLTTSSRVGSHMRAQIAEEISDPDFFWFSSETRKIFTQDIKQFRRVRKRKGQYRLGIASTSFGNKSYRGELTVLINPKTDSAATFVATTLKRKMGAKIVGNIGDASMKTSCASAPGAHQLPNTRVRILIPLMCVDRHKGARNRGNLLRPDVLVDISKDHSGLTNVNILKAAVDAIGPVEIPETNVVGDVSESSEAPTIKADMNVYAKIIEWSCGGQIEKCDAYLICEHATRLVGMRYVFRHEPNNPFVQFEKQHNSRCLRMMNTCSLKGVSVCKDDELCSNSTKFSDGSFQWKSENGYKLEAQRRGLNCRVAQN